MKIVPYPYPIAEPQAPPPPPARVYLSHYGLSEAPFTITPDPDFLFFAEGHRQSLEKLLYAIDGRMGFVLLTGEVGTGKTTLCRSLLDRLTGRADTAYVINPSVSGRDLLACILEDSGAPRAPDVSKKALIDRLHQWRLAAGSDRPFVVIIDDAQTMSLEALEDLRLLSNLETDKHKLVQVVLSGQPELLALLDSERLRQLKQRIAVHCHLGPLSSSDTAAYIARRLFVAGNQGQVNFSPAAMKRIHKAAGGIPRLINRFCDYALTAGYVTDAATIGPAHVKRAIAELNGLRQGPSVRRRIVRGRLTAVATLAALGLAALLIIPFANERPAHAPQAAERPVATESREPALPLPEKTGPAIDSATMVPAAAPPENTLSQIEDPIVIPHPPAASTVITAVAASPPPVPATYAIQLGSYKTAESAGQAVARLRDQGVMANWQPVQNGLWYRTFTGRFATVQQAVDFRNTHALDDGLIVRAPLTIVVTAAQTDLGDGDVQRMLAQMGYDSLMHKGPAGDNQICTGIFPSMEDTQATLQAINRNDRLQARVVDR